MLYEYRARECPESCTAEIVMSADEARTSPRKAEYDEKRVTCPHSYTFSRVFSSRVVSTYKQVHAAGTSREREFTSRAEFARHLRDESSRAEERTGLKHDFVPVDLNDPMVAPPPDDGHEQFLRASHDAQISIGDKTRSSFLVSAPDKG